MTNQSPAAQLQHTRTGRIDAVLFGHVVDRLQCAQRDLVRSVSSGRLEYVRADERVKTISEILEVLSGESADTIRERIAATVAKETR